MDLRVKVGTMKDIIKNDKSLAKVYDMANYWIKKNNWIMGSNGIGI